MSEPTIGAPETPTYPASRPLAAEPAPPRRGRRKTWFVATVASIVVVGAAVAFLTLRDTSTRLEKAAKVCSVSGVIDDDGRTMSLRRIAAKEEPGRVSLLDYDCILGELAVPRAVRDHMGSTRALDGTQTDEWDRLKARWTYHPDDGINLTITQE